MNTEREEKNALAFLDHIARDGGYKLRPTGYWTTNTLQLLGLRLGTGPDATSGMTPDEVQDELHVFLFVQAAPVSVVSKATRAFRRNLASRSREEVWEEFITETIDPFLATLAADVRADLINQLSTTDEIEAARVIARPPSGGKAEKDRPDPNSLSRDGSQVA